MQLNVTVDLGALQELARVFPEVVREESLAVLELVAARVESAVVAKTPRGVGGEAGLAGSIFGETAATGNSFSAVIGTPLEYGAVVELGRRPGKRQPPIEPIALWARRKLGVSDKEARSVGFLIARKIGREGFEGAHMFERTLNELEPWIMEQLAGIAGRVTRRVGSGIS